MQKILSLIIAFTLATSFYSCSKKDNNTTTTTQPVACFTISADTVNVGEIATFTSCSQNASTTTWDFGDGASGLSGSVLTHSYATSGTYTVSLTASKDTAHSVAQHTVTVRNEHNGNYSGEWEQYDQSTIETDVAYNVILNIAINGTALSATCIKPDMAATNGSFGNNAFTWSVSMSGYRYEASGTFTKLSGKDHLHIWVTKYSGSFQTGRTEYTGDKQ